ncbi:MAG: sulfotransferase family protein [Streptosporangiales bacterium]|nr:sulfotransferase family protein [Streptosporangiales bacterium]
MKVIGAGFHRTGTLSLKAALERLGFGPCYHMFELMRRPEHAARWQAAADGEAVDWQEIHGGYQSAVDWPTCYFWQELAATYPEAKVILTVRDRDRWFDSHAALIRGMQQLREDSGLLPDEQAALMGQIMLRDTFADKLYDRKHCVEVFDRHCERVRDALPPERLLVFDVGEGWRPLCAFLGVEVPDGEPFPHLNEGASVLDNVRDVLSG